MKKEIIINNIVLIICMIILCFGAYKSDLEIFYFLVILFSFIVFLKIAFILQYLIEKKKRK